MRMRDRWIEDAMEQEIYSLKKKVLSVIIGGAVGDAMGVPYEFKGRDTYTAMGMTGYGTYNQPKGSWSDDTSLTLCTMENYVEGGTLDDLLGKFLCYKENGKWTPYGTCFDMGISTSQALEKYKSGISYKLCGGDGERDNGNGSLMRMSPVLFMTILNKDLQGTIKLIREYSGITHRHPRAVLGCVIYIVFLMRIYFFEDFGKALDMTVDVCNRIIVDLDLRNEFIYYQRILGKKIAGLERREICSDGYIVNSLEAALWCCVSTNSYQEAVLRAVNLGGDTDTIAFIAGTIAGLKYGIDGIPEEWVEQLARINDIKVLCGEFAKCCYENTKGEKYRSILTTPVP